MKVRNFINCTGATMTLIGLGGIGGACEGQGSFLISAIVFAIGIGCSWATMTK